MAKSDAPTSTVDAIRYLGEQLKATAKRPNIYGYGPHDKQVKFHTSTKKRRLYIGGNRSGKTTGGIVEDLLWAMGEHPYRPIPEGPIRGRLVTTDFVNGVMKTIIPELARWVPVSKLRGGSWHTAYDKQERTLNFENGSFIELMSYDQDLDKFAGTSRHFIHFDEEPPQDIYTECMARLVDTGGECWLTMTPVEGMTWVFDVLYEPGITGDSSLIDVIEVEMGENPYLNETEVQVYLDSLTEDERKIRGQGKFIQLGGLIYKGFNPDINVIEPFDFIKNCKDWLWVWSLDHGFNNPTAWLLHVVNQEGEAFTVYEHYKAGWTVDQHAKEVLRLCREFGRMPDYFVGDPSIRNTDPITGTSIHQEYAKFGVPILLGNNDVKAGIVKVARYLKPQASGRPKLAVSRNCTNTIKEYMRYRWKTFVSKKLENNSNNQEMPHKKDDHCMDSTRYFIMSQPDLAADVPASAEEIRNILGASTAHHPTEYAVPEIKPKNDFTESASIGSSTNWVLDEHMGGVY